MGSLGTLWVNLGLNIDDFKAGVAAATAQFQQAGQAFAGSAGTFGGLGGVLSQVGAELSIVSVAITGLGEEALATYGKFEQFRVSLEALTGSAETAVAQFNNIKTLGMSTVFDLPTLALAEQKLDAIGISADKIPRIMQAAADAASAFGGSSERMQAVVQALDRVTETGVLTSRQLTTLGVTWDQLAATMGKSAAQTKDLLSKGLLDAATAMDVILQTIEEKEGGLAQKLGATWSGTWNQFKNEGLLALDAVGGAIAPFATDAVNAFRPLIEGIQALATWFKTLPAPVKDVAIALVAMAAAIGPVVLALGGLVYGVGLLSTAIPMVLGMGGAFTTLGEAIVLFGSTIGGAVFTALTTFVTVIIPEAVIAIGAFSTAILADAIPAMITLATVTIPTMASGFLSLASNAIPAAITALKGLFALDFAGLAGTITSFASSTIPFFVGALSALGVAAFAAAAAFAGWELGTWLYNNIPAVQKFGDAIGETAAKWLLFVKDLTGFSPDTGPTLNLITKLEASAAKLGITIDRGSMSLSQYGDALQKAIRGATGMADGVAKWDAATISVLNSQQKANDALKEAQIAYAQLSQAFKDGAVDARGNAISADDVTRAYNNLQNALKLAHPTIKDVGKDIDELSKFLHEVSAETINFSLKIPSDFADFQAGLAKGVNFQAIENQIDAFIKKVQASGFQTDEVIANDIDIMQSMSDQLGKFLDDDKVVKALAKITAAVDAFNVKAAQIGDKLPTSFQGFLEATTTTGVSIQGLETKITDLTAQIKENPLFNGQIPSSLQGTYDKLVATKATLTDWLNTLKLIGSDDSFTKVNAELVSMVNVMASGQLTQKQFQDGLLNWGSAVLPALVRGLQLSQAAMEALEKAAPDMAAALKNGIDAFANDLTARAESIRANSLTINNALKDLGVVSISEAANALVKSGDDIIAVLKGIGDSAMLTGPALVQDEQAIIAFGDKALPAMKLFGTTISDSVLAQIAKIAPALALAAKQGPDAFAAALEALKTKVQTDTALISDAFKSIGAQTAAQWDNNITLVTKYLDILVSTNAPIQAQLSATIQLAELELKRAQALGLSSDATLRITQNLTAAQIQQKAFLDTTMALSNLYTGMVKSFGTAWDSLEKGIGDAIVSGQDFGKVMSDVFLSLEKTISELVVKYLLDQLKNALLTNTDLLSNFGKIFTGLFADNGIVPDAMRATQKLAESVSVDLTNELDVAAKSTTQLADSTVQSVKSMTTSATQSMSSLVSSTIEDVLGLAAVVVGAIAGIIGDIEMAHMEKTLGQIETNTRITYTILNGNDGIAQWVKTTGQKVSSILDWLWDPFLTAFQSLMSTNEDSDTMLQKIEQILTAMMNSNTDATVSVAHSMKSLDAVVQDLSSNMSALSETAVGAGVSVGGLGNTTTQTNGDFTDLEKQMLAMMQAAQQATSALQNVGSGSGTQQGTTGGTNSGDSSNVPQDIMAAAAGIYGSGVRIKSWSRTADGFTFDVDPASIPAATPQTPSTQTGTGQKSTNIPANVQQAAEMVYGPGVRVLSWTPGPDGSFSFDVDPSSIPKPVAQQLGGTSHGPLDGSFDFSQLGPSGIGQWSPQDLYLNNPGLFPGAMVHPTGGSSLTLNVNVTSADETEIANKLIKTWRAQGVPI